MLTQELSKLIKRGLYKSQTGRLINADLNGALNILKKDLLIKNNKSFLY